MGLKGKLLTNDDIDLIVAEDCDVFDEDSGKLLLKFRQQLIPKEIYNPGWAALRHAAKDTKMRGTASGSKTHPYIYKDGTVSNTIQADPVKSGIVGYFDRTPRTPYCRQTAFNDHHFDKFAKAYPIIKAVDNLYQELCPVEHAKQLEMAKLHTEESFTIRGTAFTTVTVNSNWQTAVHKDAGDYPEGFGNLTVIDKGEYVGGVTCFPEWRVGVDCRAGDILMMDVHQWHGNTPIIPRDPTEFYERLSLVMYYRENMQFCGTIEEELERAKSGLRTIH